MKNRTVTIDEDGMLHSQVPEEVLRVLRVTLSGLPEFLEDGRHRFHADMIRIEHPDNCRCPWAPRVALEGEDG